MPLELVDGRHDSGPGDDSVQVGGLEVRDAFVHLARNIVCAQHIRLIRDS
jgi:hypothetical protein